MCLATDDSYFILQVDTGAITAALEAKQGLGEDGLEEAFDVRIIKDNRIFPQVVRKENLIFGFG